MAQVEKNLQIPVLKMSSLELCVNILIFAISKAPRSGDRLFT